MRKYHPPKWQARKRLYSGGPYELKRHCGMCGRRFTVRRPAQSAGCLRVVEYGIEYIEPCRFCAACAGGVPWGATPKRKAGR